MSYVDDNLMAGEQVVHKTKLHKAIFICPAVLAFFSFIILLQGRETAPQGALGLMISVVWAASTAITYKSSEFAVTNMRILIKTGFIKRNSMETLLKKVEGIQVDQGLLGRLLNYGTIKITGTGGTSCPFKKIEAPLLFRKKVQEQLSPAAG